MSSTTTTDRPVTILIVDDHPAIREGLRSTLQGIPDLQIVGEAADSAGALDCLSTTAVDVVVLDIALPGTSGAALVKAIHRASSETKVVVYTMHEEPALIAAMDGEGVTAYVLKGEPLGVLLEALRGARKGIRRFPGAAESGRQAPAGAGGEAGVGTLSRREMQVFLKLADGFTVKQAAFELGLSPKTVETYRHRLMKKLQADNVVDLAKIAVRQHLVQP